MKSECIVAMVLRVLSLSTCCFTSILGHDDSPDSVTLLSLLRFQSFLQLDEGTIKLKGSNIVESVRRRDHKIQLRHSAQSPISKGDLET